MLLKYIQRFCQVRNTIPRISPAADIMAFSEGVTNKQLVGKLEMHNVETVAKLLALATKCAREAESASRPLVGFGELNDTTIKELIILLSI
ncbi:hypothetical protein C2845_PM09G09180 [Panicum miliaceum]|uniref:Uncharacterized protein n=1 Tax=Panicum miliaceum TaxID=4540 RepID=A0A3L6S2V4_PANMI|nr:hypothetical protein C2845_PM09G09180 [Panicum miliaceum]